LDSWLPMQSITIITNIVSSNTTLCDKVCQWLATGQCTLVSSTNKTDRHNITEILLKVAQMWTTILKSFFKKFILNFCWLCQFAWKFDWFLLSVTNKNHQPNDTFNNISVISWRSDFLMEKTWVPGENHWPPASHWFIT
jgi:hypothetical protein